MTIHIMITTVHLLRLNELQGKPLQVGPQTARAGAQLGSQACISIYLSLYVYIYIYMYYIHPFIHPSIYLSIYLSILYLCFHLFATQAAHRRLRSAGLMHRVRARARRLQQHLHTKVAYIYIYIYIYIHTHTIRSYHSIVLCSILYLSVYTYMYISLSINIYIYIYIYVGIHEPGFWYLSAQFLHGSSSPQISAIVFSSFYTRANYDRRKSPPFFTKLPHELCIILVRKIRYTKACHLWSSAVAHLGLAETVCCTLRLSRTSYTVRGRVAGFLGTIHSKPSRARGMWSTLYQMQYRQLYGAPDNGIWGIY